MPRSVDLLRACGAVTAVTTAIAGAKADCPWSVVMTAISAISGRSGHIVRPHHVGRVVAGRCRRLLDAGLSQFKAGKQPKVILEAPPQHGI